MGVLDHITTHTAPILNVGSPDVFTSAGQPTTLMCEASGTPAPDVAWIKIKVKIKSLDEERFIQLADSSLFVNDTDLQDEGEYVVTAVNSAGQADQLVKVTVLRPVPPERESVCVFTSVSTWLESMQPSLLVCGCGCVCVSVWVCVCDYLSAVYLG